MGTHLLTKVDARAAGAELAIANEAHVIGEDRPNAIVLNESPKFVTGGNVDVDIHADDGGGAMTEVFGVPGPGEFRVHYAIFGLYGGLVEFHATDSGKKVLVTYSGTGSEFFARDVNRIHTLIQGMIVDVRDHGAREGKDLRPAWEAARDELVSLGAFKGKIYIPRGEWFATKNGAGRLFDLTGIEAMGITVRGAGVGQTIVTVPDGTVEWDGFRGTAQVKDLTIEDITFDGNGTENLLGGAVQSLQSWVYILDFDGVTMRNVEVRNHAGQRCITLGSDLQTTCKRAVLNNVHIRNVGGAVAGNGNDDHSSIWLNVEGTTVVGCTGVNDAFGAFSTFIEVHGSNNVVANCYANNWQVAAIIGAERGDNLNSVFIGNAWRNVYAGYRFYVNNQFGLPQVPRMSVAIEGGSVLHIGNVHPAFDTGYTSDATDTIVIRGVKYEHEGTAATGHDAPVFTIGKIKCLEVRDCSIYRSLGRVLQGTTHLPLLDDITHVWFKDNVVVDCGKAADIDATIGVYAVTPGVTLKLVSIQGNDFLYTADAVRVPPVAVAGNIPVERLEIDENRFLGINPGCAWNVGVALGRANIHVRDGVDEPHFTVAGVRASIASTWYQPAVDISWLKEFNDSTDPDPVNSYGWVKTVRVPSIPTTGAWRVRDRAIHLPANGADFPVLNDAGGDYVILEWVCVRNSNPPAAETFAPVKHYVA